MNIAIDGPAGAGKSRDDPRLVCGSHDHIILRLEGWKNHDWRNENLSRADPRRAL